MVAEFWLTQLHVFTFCLAVSFLWNRSNMQEQRDFQAPIFNGDLEDFESFQACIEAIKTDMSKTNPSQYEVLGEIVSSKQPIEERDIFQAFQSILREKHGTLRVFQEEKNTNFSEEAHQPQPIDEYTPTKSDKLQIKHEGIQLGCFLVQKTKGETQLEVTRWLQTTNAWEAWRQLNLQRTTSKWSMCYQLLTSIVNTSFDTQPASFLQQFNAWKEVVRYQQLSGEQPPDFIKLIAVVNGLKGSIRNLVLLNLDSASSFGDLDSLRSVDIDQHNSCARACRDKPESIGKGSDKESNPSFEQQLEEGGIRKGKGREKGKQAKRKGEALHPQPPAYKGKGEHAQLPREQWCNICWKKVHKTQACWWINQQHQQQHQQQQAWYTPSEPRPSTTIEASRQRSQPQLYNLDQQKTYTNVLPDNQPMLSLEHQSQASTQPAYSSPAFIAQLDSFEIASSKSETWGILVDTGAATSVAAKSFASDIELSPAPSTLHITTATGKTVKTYGLKKVHLQSQGLSLEVTFVIADVVTPLLGLDRMIKDSLSLHVEHDLQHVLVNTAGDRTQLVYMGRHLYLIACPSQLGSSPCFPGSLSHVSGFLPADKEFREQELASRSASSNDLDEDTSKHQARQLDLFKSASLASNFWWEDWSYLWSHT